MKILSQLKICFVFLTTSKEAILMKMNVSNSRTKFSCLFQMMNFSLWLANSADFTETKIQPIKHEKLAFNLLLNSTQNFHRKSHLWSQGRKLIYMKEKNALRKFFWTSTEKGKASIKYRTSVGESLFMLRSFAKKFPFFKGGRPSGYIRFIINNILIHVSDRFDYVINVSHLY